MAALNALALRPGNPPQKGAQTRQSRP